MSLLNRSQEYNHLYDSEGRLQGGLTALEELAKVIAIGSGEERDRDAMDESNDDVEPALELPVTNPSRGSSLVDSDESMSDDEEPGSSDDDAMEEIAMYEDPPSQTNWTTAPLPQPPLIVPSSPNAASLPPPTEIAAYGAALAQQRSFSSDSDNSTTGPPSHGSVRNSQRVNTLESSPDAPPPVGEKLKQKFLDMNVLSTLLVSFFLVAVVSSLRM
jgi:serine/threonine-protein phosphatase 6 regulatory subunit 3